MRRAALAVLLLLHVPVFPGHAAAEELLAARPLVELKGTIQSFDAASCRLSLTLAGPLKDVHGRPTDISLELTRAEGNWVGCQASSELWRDTQASADAGGLTFDGERLAGRLKVSVSRSPIAAANGEQVYTIDAGLSQANVLPPAVRTVAGTFQREGGAGGAVAGHVVLRRKPGFFDRGRYDGGLQLDLDMGTERVNWNHQRSAVYDFPGPRDLSEFTGLRAKVRTDQPRDDAAVTIWLCEADGSWYYLKDAVPLVDAENETVLRFGDFAMAEWVCPGNHLDEDYRLDLTSISAFAVGVVNPLGVGRVGFTLTAIELVREDLPTPGVVAASVSGKTLSVNGHNLVPAAVFGGFAEDLPAQYRPGCQRALYAPSYPIIPRQRWVEFDAACLPGWQRMLSVLKGEDAERPALARHIAGLLDGEAKARVGRVQPAKVRPDRLPRELTDPLNDLLRQKGLYDAAAFGGIELDEQIREHLKALAAGKLSDTERMELNRWLLEAAFGQAIRPAPRCGPPERFWINCYGERKETADFFRADWREHLAAWGRRFAENARASGCTAVFEFWNEPYLNWAERSWVHYRPELYKVWKAVDGGAVAVARSSNVQTYHVLDWPRLVGIFRQGAAAKDDTLEKHLFDALDRRAAEALAELPKDASPDGQLKAGLLRAVNERIIPRAGRSNRPATGRDFCREGWFAGVKLPDELGKLPAEHKAGTLDDRRLAVLNRGLLSARCPGLLAPDPAAGPDEIVPHFRWKKIATGWRVVDETAFTFWSGKGNGFIYDSMLGVIGRAIKQANPAVPVFGGWGFRWNEDHWDAWRIVYKDTIDRNIGWIDGIHEHHYQGEPTGMHGSYEVAACYGVTKHGKWLYSLNTETNDLLDSPARGRLDTPEKVRLSTEYRRMVYNMRDCIYAVLQSPDKLYGRTVIHHQRMPEAARVGYGMMRNVRGRLIETAGSDSDVWVVASVDGTDAQSMPRPDEPQRALVVFVLNDHLQPRKISLDIAAPDGTEFAGGTIQWNTVDWGTFAIDLKEAKADARGRKAHFDIEVGGKLAWKVTLPLARPIVEADQVRRRQFFSADILQEVRRGRPFATTVALDAKALGAAKRAMLRLVVEDVARGEGVVKVNGREMPLPAAYTQDNVSRIVELPLDPAALADKAAVEFSVRPGNHQGYQVDMTSIVLEERAD